MKAPELSTPYRCATPTGEADFIAVKEVQETKEKEWDLLLKNYMATRLQYMYRRRKGNKWRQKSMFKLMNAVLKSKTDKQRMCVRFMERSFLAYRVRMVFRKQLKYAFEKIYDIDSGKLFWYNCVTGESSWDRPYMLGKIAVCSVSAALPYSKSR
jgi:hypothetical protein